MSTDNGVELPELAPIVGREKLALEEDLARARELLRDGMARLQAVFDALRSHVDEQNASLSSLRDMTGDSAAQTAAIDRLVEIHQGLVRHSDTAVLSLQLEDILGQLLDFTRQRAENLSQVAAALAEAVDRDSLRRRASLHERLRVAVSEADGRSGQRHVQQTSLATGDVELF